MARRYEFGDGYTPEEAYAVPQYQRGSYWGNGPGGSMTQGPQQGAQVVTAGISAGQGSTVLRGGDAAGGMYQEAADVPQPNREGFKASSSAGRALTDGSETLARAQGDAMTTALSGMGRAQLDYNQGRADLREWADIEKQNMKAQREQKADSQKRKKGGGVLGAIGTIAGSLIGGPIGAGVGALGGLFG